MKKARNILLLLLSTSLLVGCSNGWNHPSSMSSSEQSEPSSSSEEPPLPPEPGNYNVLYPIEDPGLNPLDPHEVELIFNELASIDNGERMIRDMIGSDTLDVLLSCNHIKAEQIGNAVELFKVIAAETKKESPGPYFLYDMFCQLDKIDIDSLIITLREIKHNPDAFAGLARVIKYAPDAYEGKLTSYQTANAYFNGTNPGIRAAAEDERRMDEAYLLTETPTIYSVSMDLVDDEGALGFFRFFSHIATSFMENMSDDEILCSIAMMNENDPECREILERLAPEIMGSAQSYAEYFNHLGAAITNMNLDLESWAAVLPSLEKFIISATTADYEREYKPYPRSNIEQMANLIKATVTNVDNTGVKAVIKLLGLVGENLNAEVAGLILEEHSNTACVANLYNKAFGLLTEAERNQLDKVCFFYGINLSDFNDKLQAYCEAGDVDAVGELIDETFNKIPDYYDFDYESIPMRNVNDDTSILYFRQGDTINANKLKVMLARTEDFYMFEIEGNGHYEDVSKRQVTLLDSIDTSTPGQRTMRVNFKVYVPTSDEENPQYDTKTYETILQYYVVPREVTYFVKYQYIRATVNGTSVEHKPKADSEGNKVGKVDNWILLEKGKAPKEGEAKAKVDLIDCWIYSDTLGRYVSTESSNVQAVNQQEIDLSTVDVSTIGEHYVSVPMTVLICGVEQVVLAGYVPYHVVNKITAVEDGTYGPDIVLD